MRCNHFNFLFLLPRYLRSYGQENGIFLFEAGRRCALGPGRFGFAVEPGDNIFTALDTDITKVGGWKKKEKRRKENKRKEKPLFLSFLLTHHVFLSLSFFLSIGRIARVDRLR